MDAPPRFAKRVLDFRCLAERCEDTCCVGLRVPVSEERLYQLRTAMKGAPDEKDVEAMLADNRSGPPSERSFIRMQPDGSCPFLDTEKLCSLQRRYGEGVLPDACATFPRIISRWNEQVEVTGSLACPEMARLLLLEEGALEQVPGPLEQVPRLEAARPIPGEPGDAYFVHAPAIRAAALKLWHRQEFPLSSRLMFLGQLAFRLDSIFRGAEPFVGPDTQRDEAVQVLLQSVDSLKTLEVMHQEFLAVQVPGGPCVGLLGSMLKVRASVARGARFAPFVQSVLQSLWGSEQTEGDPGHAWSEYTARWQRLQTAHGARVEQYFLNYGISQWLRSPIQELPNLLSYVFRLVLRVGMLRLALVGHPDVAALCAPEQGAAPEEARAVLDRAAVDCFYLLARHVETAPDVLSLVKQLTGAGGAETLGKTLIFAKFC